MFYNPYMQMNRGQGMEQFNPYSQNYPQIYPQNSQTCTQASYGLQGKLVDSIDVVKAIDIPLDGSVSYFPIVDGSLIVTKQLQKDGTSKTMIYKPIEKEEMSKKVDYITSAEFDKRIAEKTENYAEDIKSIKKQIKDVLEDLRRIKGRDDYNE